MKNLNDYAGDESYDYPFDIVLTADESLTNTGVRTDTDSDFILLGMTINAFTSILFSIQLKDQNGNFFHRPLCSRRTTPARARNLSAFWAGRAFSGRALRSASRSRSCPERKTRSRFYSAAKSGECRPRRSADRIR